MNTENLDSQNVNSNINSKDGDFTKSKRFVELEKCLICPQCGDILCEPVTLFCQHTMCQSCMLLHSTDKCVICGKKSLMPSSPNFQLKNIIEKIYGEKYINERKDNIDAKINSDLKLKRQYKIRKEYFNNLVNKISDYGGKFSMSQLYNWQS